MQQMTVQQYAVWRGITPQAVTKRIRKGGILKGVLSVTRIGWAYLLDVDKKEALKK